MNKEQLESNIRFSHLYSTLYKINTDNVEYNDLYKSENFKKRLKNPEFGLYLWSNSPGSWKTTTAIKLAKFLIDKWQTVLSLSLIDYKDYLKKDFWKKDRHVKSFADYLPRYDFILLDDISYWISWDWTQEVIKQLLDNSFNNKKPKLIFTSQVSIDNLPVHNAIKSRIAWLCKEVHFHEKDLRRANANFDF